MDDVSSSLLRLGTSSWSVESWVGGFYPPRTQPSQFLSFYAQQYNCVEVDNTFYRIPSHPMVRKWREDTPPGFLFAAKVPRVITHQKVLDSCQDDLSAFLKAMELLGDKRGPLLLQFPYFNKSVFASANDFLDRLSPFLKGLSRDWKWALEIRNKWWINQKLLDMLRENQVAFALIDQAWMPRIGQILKRHNPDTADFTYIRWLGDRKGIEEKTKQWDRVIQNREREMETWIPTIDRLLERRLRIYAYFNNHYAGFAPGSIALFREVWISAHGQDFSPR